MTQQFQAFNLASVDTDRVSKDMAANGVSASNDWQGRYNHIDQILEQPGPRTDESFGAGDTVSTSFQLSRSQMRANWRTGVSLLVGQGVPQKPM